ncbi:hypothetical protein [Oceanobacter mangrovi]|uniref:hypothetical protein n=1 Tax=Oceanobacter mangrovi TaxID=2862510 RepID=UPI001C8E6D7A|nr:hypothetical protein [Oceanobacter mangrovi]
MKTKITAMAAILVAGLNAQAGVVDSGNITTFTAGTAAKASEVNGNFDAVVTAVDANATDISSLQSTITDLQTQLTNLQDQVDGMDEAVTLDDLVGRSYCMVGTYSGVAYQGDNFARVNLGAQEYRVSITSSSQVTVTIDSEQEAELGMGLELYSYDDNGTTYETQGLQGTLDSYSNSGTSTLTINSFADGVLSLTDDEGTHSFYVNKMGDTMIASSFTNNTADQEMWTGINILVECR